jgi:hypothetical protein
MDIDDCQVETRVIYCRGIKGPLIGCAGVIESVHEYDKEMVIVSFDRGGTYVCWVGNLDPEV